MTLHPDEMENIESNETERKTALIVDDDKGLLKALEITLNLKAYIVKTAMTPEEVKNYREEEFDIAIIDGLGGQCFDVFNIINAKRKVIYTGDKNCIKEARKRRIKVYDKLTKNIDDILK